MSLLARAAFLGALLLALAGLPSVAAAKTVLIFSPHPDDEALVAAGHVRAAVAAGHTVKIIVFTNGDFLGVERGLERQGESVASAQVLGLTEQDVIFLGYPDGALMQIYNAPSPSDVITSNAGQTQTYGNRGLGGTDFHRHWFGAPGPYNRVTVEQDVRTLLEHFRPDEIYTVSHFDTHPDHHAVAVYVTEALVALKRSGVALSTKLYQGIVWTPGRELDNWPDAGGCAPNTPFAPPQGMQTQLEWKRTLRATVLANLKCEAISAFASQATPLLKSFARKDEFFWLSDFGANLAITAQVTASSENNAANQGRQKAVDGLIDGAPNDAVREWASVNELSGPWIELAWPEAVSVAQVNLYDRPHGGENVLAGTLAFSDGTSIAVGALPPDGKLLPVTFPPKTVTWVRFTIDQAEGTAAGLSEIQVLGVPLSAGNVAPHFLEGPGGNSATSIRSVETASFSVIAHDLNGDPVQYEWSADGGTIEGSGASAVFTPPAITENAVFTITARILDGRGGSASSVGFVTVTPAVDGISVSPTVVFGGEAAQGTVTLAQPAAAGGLSVPLSSSNPSVAAVPASVTVPAGAVSVSFPVSTSTVGARTEVTLSANINGTPRSATLIVGPRPSPVPPENVLLSPDSIGDANWFHFGAIRSTLNFAAAPDGTQNASRAESTVPGHALTQLVNVAESTQYTFSFYARNNGGTAAAYSVHCASLGTDIVAATPYIGSINGSSWTQVSVTFTTPAGCTQIFVYPVRDSGSPVDVLLWRATLVRAGTSVTPALASLAVSPSSVTGGGSATGTATLTAAAPAGGAQVALSSSDPAVTVPASVTVADGATSATFTVSTNAVSTPASATLSGSYGGATQTATLTVLPAVISSLSVTPASVPGGNPATGTVTLNGPAPAGGAQVALTSSSAAASVPASVTVAPGATSASFSVTTSTVETSTPVTISGTYGGATQTGSLTVLSLKVASLSLSQASVTGGSPVTGTVTLDGPAPAGGAQVALSSSNAAASVPASVTVAAGTTSATFNVATSAVGASTSASISASYGGGTQSVSLTVLPPVVSSLDVSPASVTGGTSSTGTVTLNGPAPAGGAQVVLSSNNTAVTVPAGVTVAAGATSASFNLGTSAVPTSTSASISASYGGATRTASLTVLPPVVSTLNVSPASVTGGTGSSGSVTLNGPAPEGGAQVALSSNNTVVTVQASVTVAAGATSATFSLGTTPVATSSAATISASYGGATRTATLTVLPPVPTALSVSPTSVTGGTGGSTGTVTLNGPAPAGGAQVALSSNSGAASVPVTVTVLAGATSASFSIGTSAVADNTAVTISASYGGGTRTATLTVLHAVLTSLTLNPTSVIGGPLGNSTGTVRLNGPAPAGGAVVALSSNTNAAQVPATVTIPAGATSATFTVRTSIILISTQATITATYKGVSRSATLDITL